MTPREHRPSSRRSAREVHGDTWGFVQAHLDRPDHTRLVGLLIAFRATPAGPWTVVSLHVDGV